MNINYIQYREVVGAKTIEFSIRNIYATFRNGQVVLVPITKKQYAQPHNKLVYGHKWERTLF